MFAEAVIVMTVYGCGNDFKSCDYLTETKGDWEDQTACIDSIPTVISRQKGAPYPVITARCEAQTFAINKFQSGSTNLAVLETPEGSSLARSSSGYLQTTTMFDEIRAKTKDTDDSLLAKVKKSVSKVFAFPRVYLAKLTQQESN